MCSQPVLCTVLAHVCPAARQTVVLDALFNVSVDVEIVVVALPPTVVLSVVVYVVVVNVVGGKLLRDDNG